MVRIYVKLPEEEFSVVFQELGPSQPVRGVVLSKGGKDVLYEVTGWTSTPVDAPAPAMAQPVADSGDARAILIYGGDLGVLLKPASVKEEWNPSSPNQERRPYILVSSDTDLRFLNAER